MIKVRFKLFNNGSFKFACEGHAGAGKAGSDLVCAAASVLAQGFCRNIELAGEMLSEKSIDVDDGVIKLSFKPHHEYITSIALLFSAKYNEFKALEKGNEKYIKVVGNGDAR